MIIASHEVRQSATTLGRKLPSTAKSEFFAFLRDNFSPELRRLGFKGSGQNFLRIRGEVVNVVNIQGNKYGGSVAVNLGLHLAFLPNEFSGELLDLSKIREFDCEFRTRLTPKWRFDHWWKYEGLFRIPAKEAAHLVATYIAYGEPMFSRLDNLEKIVNLLSPENIATNSSLRFFGEVSSVRAALVFAKINMHLGEVELAREFAQAGLNNLGTAIALRPQFEALLDAT